MSVITQEGIHLGPMLSSGCISYFNSNVYFKQTQNVKQYHYGKSSNPYPLLPTRFLLLEPLSSSYFLLINVAFSSNGHTPKLLDVSISDSYRHPPGPTSDYGNISFLRQPGVFPRADNYTIRSLQRTPVQGCLVPPALKPSPTPCRPLGFYLFGSFSYYLSVSFHF